MADVRDVSCGMKMCRSILSLITFLLAAFLAVVGAFGIQAASSVNDIEVVFVGVYMILFATTVFLFELIQLFQCIYIDEIIKRNLGFIYGPKGRGGYLLL